MMADKVSNQYNALDHFSEIASDKLNGQYTITKKKLRKLNAFIPYKHSHPEGLFMPCLRRGARPLCIGRSSHIIVVIQPLQNQSTTLGKK